MHRIGTAAVIASTLVSPVAAPVVRASSAGTAYEAAAHTRRTIGFRAPSASPNTAVLGSLTTLRDRSRTATRNNGYARSVIDELVTNMVGTGIKPMSKAARPEFRQQVQELWLRWTDESDADGLLDWYGQQAQAVRAWLDAGEVFVRLRPRLPRDRLVVPLQVQVIEPELCPHTYDTLLANGNRVRAGIEFNAIGRREAYWFHPSRPGDLQDFDASQLRRVPADQVIHLYDPQRPGQLRGIPHLTPALIKLHELDKYDDAVLLRQQLANLFVAFLTRGTATDESLHPMTGLPVERGTKGEEMLTLEAGIFQELAPGEDVTFSTPPPAGDGYKDFMRQQLFSLSASSGVPYEAVSGDMSGVNDRTVRVIFNKFRLRIQATQHHIIAFQLCRPVWEAWMDSAAVSGALPIGADYLTSPQTYTAVKWTPPRTPYIHPVQDVEAQQDAIRAGLTSRSAVVSELGEDAEVIDAEQAADNTRADAHGLKYDSDARQAKAAAAPKPRTNDPEPAGATA